MSASTSSLAVLNDGRRPPALLQELAGALGVPLVDAPQGASLLLRFSPDGLEFCKPGDPTLPGVLRIDFSETATRRRILHPGRELVVQAAKVRTNQRPLLVDATAGLGRDGFLLAAAGFRVRMIEYNPVVAALLADGLERARGQIGLSDTAARIELVPGDSLDYLAAPTEQPDVVYLDPMFPERSKSALVKQELRLLQLIDCKHTDPARLLQAALNVHARKVVVKRPLKGPCLMAAPPAYSLRGKAVRFDVYVGTGKREVS